MQEEPQSCVSPRRDLLALFLFERLELILSPRDLGPIRALQLHVVPVEMLTIVARDQDSEREDKTLVDRRDSRREYSVEARPLDVELAIRALGDAVCEKRKIELHAPILWGWGKTSRKLG